MAQDGVRSPSTKTSRRKDLDLLWFFPGAQPVCLGHYLAPMSTPAPVSEYPTSTLGLSDNPRSKPPTGVVARPGANR